MIEVILFCLYDLGEKVIHSRMKLMMMRLTIVYSRP